MLRAAAVAQLAAALLPGSAAANWQCNAALNLNAGCSQHGGADCLVCAGKDQWVLRVAGCSNADIQDYCNVSPNGAHCSTAQGMAYNHDMTGKVAVLTGGDTGIGYETALALAGVHATVVIAAYDLVHGTKIASNISAATGNSHVSALQIDLASFASVRSFANSLMSQHAVVDILLNDAGISDNPTGEITKDGFERVMQVNYIGPFLLTELLLPALRKSAAAAKVINVASGASFQACSWSNRGPNCLSGQAAWTSDATTPCPPKTGFQAMNTNYGITKFMQVAHMKALAARERRLKSTLHAYSLRPGYVETPMTDDPDPGGMDSYAFCVMACGAEGLTCTQGQPGGTCPMPPQNGAATPSFLSVTDITKLTEGAFYYECDAIAEPTTPGWDWKRDPERLFNLTSTWIGAHLVR